MEDASVKTSMAGAGGPPPGPVRKVLEWFWRGKALKSLRAETKQTSLRGRELAERAQLLFTLGERARHPSEPLPSAADAAAAELYRQAAYFAARALAEQRSADSTEPWKSVDNEPLREACGGPTVTAELIGWVETGAFADSWEASKEQRSVRAAELSRLCQFLLRELAWPTRARDALWTQRAVRIGGVFLVILGALLSLQVLRDRAERKYDVAVGKAWRTSSSAGMGCNSPQQTCGNGTDFFFHTNEERNPWVELDLGEPLEFTAVRVVNRRDCCFERAIPLVIEVGSDPEHFKEVARRTTPFSAWRADFPRTKARYVRARAMSKTMLHLSEVRILTQ